MVIDFHKFGIVDGLKKWGKILLWVAFAAIVNFAFQALAGVHFHDIFVYGFAISDDLQNLVMTGFLNGFFAGFAKWVTTNKDNAINQK
jgi:hypothetical protein